MNLKAFTTPQIIIFLLALVVVVGGYFLIKNNQGVSQCFGTRTPSGGCIDAAVSLIDITSPKANDSVSSPISISGTAKADWGIFEGQAGTVHLYDSGNNELNMAVLKVNGDWTQPEVQFTATLDFASSTSGEGKLVFKNDNASGDPARDKTYEVPVKFK